METYEVLAVDLDRLDELVSAENRALGWTTSCFSAALSTVVSWVSMSTTTGTQKALFLAIILSGIGIGSYCLIDYLVARQKRPALLERIRANAAPVHDAAASSAAS